MRGMLQSREYACVVVPSWCEINHSLSGVEAVRSHSSCGLCASRRGAPSLPSLLRSLAVAHDTTLVASTLEELQETLRIAQDHFKILGLALNNKKTVYFGWTYDSHREKWFDYGIPGLRLGGAVAAPVAQNVPIWYLGVYFYINKPPRVSVDLIQPELELVRSFQLKPFQKLH